MCVFQLALQSIQTGTHPCRAHKSDQGKAGIQAGKQTGRQGQVGLVVNGKGLQESIQAGRADPNI